MKKRYHKKRGRKSFAEELRIKDRYAILAPRYFEVLQEFLNSKSKIERKWAVEQLTKAFVKMIPQQIEGDSDNPIPILTIQQTNVSTNNSNPKNSETNKEDKGNTGRNSRQQDNQHSAILDTPGTN